MRTHERIKGLLRGPGLAWDILVRGRYPFIYDRMPMRAERMPAAKRINLLRSGANLLYRRLRPWSMPLHMQFELTNYCNLRCPVCPTGTRTVDRPPLAMEPALFEKLWDEAGPYLLTASLWAWGEPLLHPRLREILRVARRHDVVTLLSTNGQSLAQEPVLEALIEEPPHYLIVALDGLTDETNSAFRSGARIAPILEGVRILADLKRQRGRRRPILNMRFIVWKHNQHEVAGVRQFAAAHGFVLLTLRSPYFIESTSDPQTRAGLAPGSEVWEGCGLAGGGYTARDSFFCLEPFWFPTVLADGTLVLCEQDYNGELAVGRIEDGVTFSNLWYGNRAARLRQAIRDEAEGVAFCRKCIYADRPITDCNLAAYQLHGLGKEGL